MVVSNYGVFVFETKNYKGWILGGEHSKYWTQDAQKKWPKLEIGQKPCPSCFGTLVIRSGKHGVFKGCTNFPACNYTRPLDKQDKKPNLPQ